MVESHGLIGGIPAIFWGSDRSRRLIAVHGFGGGKGDRAIRLLARRAVPLGWQVISCDLPGHGNRDYPLCPYEPKRCVEDLRQLFARVDRGTTALFAQGAGAQWALLAYQKLTLARALLLSPAVGPGLPLQGWTTPTAILAPPGRAAPPSAGRRTLPRNITAPSPRPPGPTAWSPGWSGCWPEGRQVRTPG